MGSARKNGSLKQEQGFVRSIGGTPHKNSGRGQLKKGDATWHQFIIDVKHSEKSFTLNTDVWAKICTDAARVDILKDPALIVVFNNGKTRLAVVALDVLERLMDAQPD